MTFVSALEITAGVLGFIVSFENDQLWIDISVKLLIGNRSASQVLEELTVLVS